MFLQFVVLILCFGVQRMILGEIAFEAMDLHGHVEVGLVTYIDLLDLLGYHCACQFGLHYESFQDKHKHVPVPTTREPKL